MCLCIIHLKKDGSARPQTRGDKKAGSTFVLPVIRTLCLFKVFQTFVLNLGNIGILVPNFKDFTIKSIACDKDNCLFKVFQTFVLNLGDIGMLVPNFKDFTSKSTACDKDPLLI